MDIFSTFLPPKLINSVPRFVSRDGSIPAAMARLIKSKLLKSEQNAGIIRLARGDGRKNILDEIVDNSYVLFDWGLKAAHAFLEDNEFRRFLDPNVIDKGTLLDLASLYSHAVDIRLERDFHADRKNTVSHSQLVDTINSLDSEDDLLLIKDWMCNVLHTSGDRRFASISPWVSASQGEQRYKTAYWFGENKSRRMLCLNNSDVINHRYVIFDYWVPVTGEGCEYEYTRNIRSRFMELGVPWYRDIHKEVMIKYALYPQQLIGYYYFENDNLCYYFVNPHYLDEWSRDAEFSIGEYLDLDQSRVKFPANNPYRTIYSKCQGSFFVHDRR